MADLSKQLNNGAEVEVNVMNGFGNRSEVAILINGQPVQVTHINNNRTHKRFDVTSDFKTLQQVSYADETPTLDDVASVDPDENEVEEESSY
jgi:hypothetical protein